MEMRAHKLDVSQNLLEISGLMGCISCFLIKVDGQRAADTLFQ
jgi:hypothetical protein